MEGKLIEKQAGSNLRERNAVVAHTESISIQRKIPTSD